LVAELDEEGAPVSTWIRGHEVVGVEKYEVSNDELDDAESLSTTYLPRRYFYHQDEQGSTVSITNDHQEEVNAYHYDAFGKVLEAREGITNPITYTGQQYDQATQQYYLRARFYNPAIGRFTQEDVYRGDGLNLYAYCKANPVMYYDPTGYMGCNKDSGKQGKDDTPGTNKNKNGGESANDLPSRKGALNEAKRDAKIPKSQQPDYVDNVPMRQAEYEGGHVIKDVNGNVIMTREYHYTNMYGEKIVIQDHSAGHAKGGQGAHFNVRPEDKIRTGSVDGTKDHYPFN
jgi:RHS repeat-associated protein